MKKHIIEVPLTPNFLKYRGHAFPIADFDDEELRELGARWTEALIAKAQKRRPF